ncbi:uncharacterized protein FFB20_03364 [Fusarium fujikuroi]|uniref:Uncharacterized protein n=2 Tax=Fusarium fujikuroi TaxID=5127 RepID=S0E9J4_GIBF5|nr:uncharacterized protein FFUJ_08358 [Fusarium fujikuroi IMI 58289]KLP00511.1 uncharacterized protein Y057_11066 [Fusarium fujikuroi]KLP17742.1 uncharacterized protein LW94_5132 [Fusarium fujikuroi]QGI67308.1 hypothetical protein CEK27_011279 [Fusarium fujikuroi]QGI84539.1 hypothetical protein CEK25_011268 [Fusarium fujikuroi]QGI98192.1 hypothetical protein CEK26_011261 [Fusarium fujikuroi]
MRHIVYTARELLRLRHKPPQKDISNKLVSKVLEDRELEDIIRTPFVNSPSLSLIIEEGNSSDADEMHRRPAQQLDGTDSDRKYRGRSDSELDRAPTVAPADLATQKSEGFQKFYNSVVSPTHVRVTAGGRIVPNTRGPHSPTTKWSRERSSIDGQSQARNMNGNQPEGVAYPVLPPSWGHFAPMVPPHAPGTLPGMALRPEGMPFMPPPMGYNLAPISYSQFPTTGLPMQLPSQAASYGKLPDAGMEQARNVHLSPTDQFDNSRPFLYNGQWWIANGGTLYPISMPPQMSFASPVVPSPSAPRPSVDFNAAPARYGHPSSRQPEQLPLRLQNEPSRSASPPVSSIRPSSITQKQLEVLRSQKRYHQDQLRYNKHQIDVRDMEEQLENICREIEHFERMLTTQLEFESRKYPPEVVSPNGPPSNSSNDYGNSNSESDGLNAVNAVHLSGFGNKSTVDETGGTFPQIASVQSRLQITADPSAKNFSNASKNNDVQQRKPSSLPIHAALAPVFQPRSDLSTSAIAPTEVEEVDEGAQIRQYERMYKNAEGWRTFFRNKLHADKSMGPPYLIGKLKPGVRPENARDTDYVYDRELTPEEERARFTYWGRAPFIFENGLPLYDGKNFYPPCVIKEEPVGADESVPQNAFGPDESKTPPMKPNEVDPFHAVSQATRPSARYAFDDATRSESLHRTDDSLHASSTSEVPRSESHAAHSGSRYLEFRRAINERPRIPSEKLRARASDDSGDEEGNLLFKGRRVDRDASKYPKDIWSTMRKNGKTSANVVAGQVSPMTAQGVLPHYAGHATASLTPAVTTNSRGNSAKLGDVNASPTGNITVGRREENRPPLELLDQQLRGVSLQDKSHHGFSTR